MKGLTLSLLLIGLIGTAVCHTYHLGECPVVEPKSDFHMSKFLGLWYAIQKTSTGSRCLTYNFTVGEEPGEYFIEQVREHLFLGIAGVDNKYHYKGSLKASQDAPARMTVKFPLNIAGSSSFIVFSTDYNTYAGIYTCQKLPASNRRSVTILSRTKTLDKQYIDKVRNAMSLFGISPFDLSLIDHTKCPKEETRFDVNINPDTFTAENIGLAVRKSGEKLGNGVTTILKQF